MESVLRSLINTALGSVIHPLDEDEFRVTKEKGFVLKDVIVDHKSLNSKLNKSAEGAIQIDHCDIEELRVNYDWTDGAAVIDVTNLSISVRPRVGRMVKKKILGCLDYTEDADQRRKGASVYDPGWGPSDRLMGPKYCPHCGYNLKPYSDDCSQKETHVPRMIVSHQRGNPSSLPPPHGHRSVLPSSEDDRRYHRRPPIAPPSTMQLPASTSPILYRPSPMHGTSLEELKEMEHTNDPMRPQKKSVGVACASVMQHINDTMQSGDDDILHPYMAPPPPDPPSFSTRRRCHDHRRRRASSASLVSLSSLSGNHSPHLFPTAMPTPSGLDAPPPWSPAPSLTRPRGDYNQRVDYAALASAPLYKREYEDQRGGGGKDSSESSRKK